MTTVKEIESAVTRLSQEELHRFRAWFDQFEAELWDRQIEEDIRAGKLDGLADQAISEFRAGRCTEL